MGMLEGRVAIVTGAARGMGSGIARRFVQEGARVVVADVADQPGSALAHELGSDALFARLDVREEEAWGDLAKRVMEHWGSIDILVNNAGIAQLALLADMSLEDYRRIVDVNQTGVFLGMRACIPAMKKARKGAIINNSSIGGMFGQTGFGAYNASKHAVLGLTRAAALELAEHNIRVNAICPGGVDTPMGTSTPGSEMLDLTANSTYYPIGRMGTIHEIAALVTFLACDESSYITGAVIPIDGGWTAGFRMILKPEYR